MLLCSLVIGCIVAVFLGRATLISQLNAWKLLPRPERFTELYFAQNTQLPTTFTVGGQQIVAFSIHNLEQQKTTYHYQIVAKATNKQQVLAEGNLTLLQGGVQSVARPVAVPSLGDHVEMRVSIAYRGIPSGKDEPTLETQSIHYWMYLAT